MEINNFLLHPALNPLQADLVKELLSAIPLFHGRTGLVCVTPTASRDKVVSVAGAGLKAGYDVIKGGSRFVTVTALAVPGVVYGLSITFLC